MHPNPNLPGGDRAKVSPTPEGAGPAAGASPAHGRARRAPRRNGQQLLMFAAGLLEEVRRFAIALFAIGAAVSIAETQLGGPSRTVELLAGATGLVVAVCFAAGVLNCVAVTWPRGLAVKEA